MIKKSYDIIVIGGGPAGLMAALSAAEKNKSVLLIEKMSHAGKKLLITGNGRCNITNNARRSDYFKRIYPNSKFLKPAFSHFFNKEIIDFFNLHGLATKEESHGKIYPVSNKASDVLNTLLKVCMERGVEIMYNTFVSEISTIDICVASVKCVQQDKTIIINTQNVIVCTGGLSYPKTGSTGDGYALAKKIGHSIVPVYPSMVALETAHNIKEIQGISMPNAAASLWINNKKVQQASGDLLFTHFGLSGPLTHVLSRKAVMALEKDEKVEIGIDLFSAIKEQDFDSYIISLLNMQGKRHIDNVLKQFMPYGLVIFILNLIEVDAAKECHQINAKERQKLRHILKDFRFLISTHRGFKEAIITNGGVCTTEIKSHTLESKIVSGLYFAGEVINIDAETGGYNLQIAFSTGRLAGISSTL